MSHNGSPEPGRRDGDLEVLYETIRDLTSTLAVTEVVERLLERILLHLESEIGSVLLLDPEGALRIVLARGLPLEVVSGTRIPPGEEISGYVLRTGEPLLITDIENDARFGRRNHERYYTRSCLSAPLVIGNEPRGVINVNNKSSHRPFDPRDLELLAAIAGHAAVALSNAQQYEELLERAQRDPLTKLANHGCFWSSLAAEVKRSQRYERPLSTCLIDIDHFKAYNDRHGHVEGDRALVAVADAIAANSRTHDLVARYGGEEFGVVLPETPREGATRFAEKIRAIVELADLEGGHGAPVTISIGVASYPEDGHTPEALVRAADRELYRAKQMGRNRVCTKGQPPT